ncbi:MAG: hypothetical protein ACUVS2_09560 [Candidatus Flexifilum sp.]|jgi:chromosome segregation ATPase
MDTQQTVRMIEWLDEQRRQDRLTIAALQERLAQQQDVIDALTRRVASVESDQTLLSSQVTPPNRDLDILDQMRREMQQMIEAVEAKRLTAERESERRAELARELQMRQIRELSEKYGRIERTTTELPAISSEKDRLLTLVNTLQQRVDDLFKRLEDPERRIVQIEEQRRTDSRRLSELESEIPEVRRAVDSLKPKITLIEDLALRNERRVNDILNTDRDRREQIQQFIDQQTLTEQQREGQVQELLSKFAEQEAQMQRNIERFETWAEAYREMKKIIDDFERIGERLERRINEVAEMQRLSEERFRQEWNDYRGEEQKRWKQFTLNTDEVWRQHDRDFERFTARLTQLEESLPAAFDAIQRLWQLERDRAQLYRERYQALLLEYDKGMPASPAPQTKNGTSTPSTASPSGAGVTPSPLTAPPAALKTTTSTLPAVPPPAAPSTPTPLSPLSGSDSGGTG